jgi:hypothetical protein
MKTYKKFLQEAKQVGKLYHLVSQDKMKFILKTNSIKSQNFPYISTTRDKLMSNYVGDVQLILYRIVLDGNELSHKYKITPFSYRSSTGVDFSEYEEQIKTSKISDINKYVVEVQKITPNIRQWEKWLENPEDDYDRRLIKDYEYVNKNLHTLGKVVEVLK